MNEKFIFTILLGAIFLSVVGFFVYNFYFNNSEENQFLNEAEPLNNFNINQENKNCHDLGELVSNLVVYQPSLEDLDRCFNGLVKRNPIPSKFY